MCTSKIGYNTILVDNGYTKKAKSDTTKLLCKNKDEHISRKEIINGD